MVQPQAMGRARPIDTTVTSTAAFTGYRQFLSSDWMLTQLSIDPERNLKRYGDGFAEQRLVDDQIFALTGRRFLSGYASTEAEFQALMNAGIMFASSYQLTPGVALSAEQMAALTSDIVWLETQTVLLPDGSTAQALVPKVYLRRPAAGDITPTGSLISASSIDLRSPSGDITNSGTLYAWGDAADGAGKVNISAANVNNSGTIAGNRIGAQATGNITQIGGQATGLGAGSIVRYDAGGNIILQTTTQTSSQSLQGPYGTTQVGRTNVDRIATIAGDNVILAALGNIDMAGASVNASQNLAITATGTINASAVQESYSIDIPLGGSLRGKTGGVAEGTLTNFGTSLNAGGNLSVNAVGAVTMIGSTVNATGTVAIIGQSVTIDAAKDFASFEQSFVKSKGYTVVGRSDETLSGGVVSAGNNVTVIANGIKAEGQGNITLTGATIAASTGQASLIANNDVTIQNATTEHSTLSGSYDSHKGFLSSSSTQRADSSQTIQVEGSNIIGNTVLVQAGNDATVQASQISAVSDARINAGRDINIITAQESGSASNFYEQERSGLSTSLGQISIGKSAQDQTQAQQSTTQVGSTISAANIGMTAGRDANITASALLADRDINVSAGRNINLDAATDTQDTQAQAHSSSTVIGLAPTGLSGRFTLFGQNGASQNGNSEGTSQSTSLLSANGGNLTLIAGTDAQYRGTGQGNVTGQGTDLLAKGAVTVIGNAVDLQPAQNTSNSASHAESRSLTIGSQLTGAIGGAITRIGDMVEEADNTSNSRLQGALTLKAGYDAYKEGARLAAAVEAGKAAETLSSGIGVSVSISSTRSSQDSTQASTISRGTNIQAQAIDITARDTDITATGAKLQAQDISLCNPLTEAAAPALVQRCPFGGTQNGLSFQASASQSKGYANGSEVTYDNTQVTATGLLRIKSGGDTNLQGGQVAGGTVKMDVGGNLNLETLQDQSQYESKQTSSGLAISVCVPPLCYGATVTGSVNASNQTIDHNYLSATGQSGIAAGAGGFDITVAGNTDLKGAALTSSADRAKNTLQTGSLTYSDLSNTQTTDASSTSLSLGYGGATAIAGTLASNLTGNLMGNLQGSNGLPASGSQAGVTQSVISPANVRITGTDATSAQNATTLTGRDAGTANGGLQNTLTLQQAQEVQSTLKQQQDNQRAAELVGAAVTTAIGDLATTLQWNEGSNQKLALHGLAGLIQAKVGGGSALVAIAAGMTQETLAPVLGEYLRSNGYDYTNTALTPEQQRTVKADYDALMQAGATIAGAALGAVAGGTAGAATGASVALTGVTNNYLKHTEIDRLLIVQAACGRGDQAACAERDGLQALSNRRDAALNTCSGTETTYCNGLRQEVRVATAEILRNATTNPDTARTLEVWRTQGMANSTLSTTDRIAGVAAGFAMATADGLVGLAQGVASLTRAALGDEASKARVGQTLDSLVRLSDPATLAQVISAASAAQREQLAKAYESGDAFAVGLVGGQVLASLPIMPVGSIRSVGTAVKTADQVVIEATGSSSIWSSSKSLTSVENAFGHWQKHSAEFPELANAKQYVEAAQAMATNPPSGALTKMRGTDTLIYDPSTNIFLVSTVDGVPRTMFKPLDGINYWNRQ